MAKGSLGAPTISVTCPCCQAKLVIDPKFETVIRHEEPPRKLAIDDLAAAAQALKGESAKRDKLFEKSFEQHRNAEEIRARKFDELFKKAKEDDPTKPPPKPLGLE